MIVGSTAPGPYGLALVLPPIAALLIAMRGQHGLLLPGPTAPYSELSSALGYLFVGSLLCQALSYAGYIAAIVLHNSHQQNLVGDLAVGIFIARIPILGFQAVQAALLPKLARLAGAGRDDEFRSSFRQLVLIVVGVGAIGVVGGFAAGHAVGQLLFGTKFTLEQPRCRTARGRQRRVHPRAHACAGIDRTAELRRRHMVVGRWRGRRRRRRVRGAGTDPAFGAELRDRLFGRGSRHGICLAVRMRAGIPVGTMERLTMDLEHEPLEI